MSIDHAVDARRRRRELEVAQDRGAPSRQRAGAGGKIHGGLELGQALLVVLFDQFGRGIDVFFGDAHRSQRRSSAHSRPVLTTRSTGAAVLRSRPRTAANRPPHAAPEHPARYLMLSIHSPRMIRVYSLFSILVAHCRLFD